MATAVRLLLAMLLLGIFAIGESQRCDTSTIRVHNIQTGGKHNNLDFIFEVQVTNLCRCPLSNVHLRADGLSSSMPVDPKVFREDGTSYLVNDGKPIASHASFKFQYAFDRGFHIFPTDNFMVNC
ncbi:uncharacterized protein LOC103697714 [Phoenix dactylifera]|uniref:Uncharacterized protein LOC103697714 n=1 Tax=Phoenix dactylifera TaxID=42345 RepID=A0A8B7BJ68_PHODC|nr:uncharacterized protein LOC103697714 [Phoenix dactylifera]